MCLKKSYTVSVSFSKNADDVAADIANKVFDLPQLYQRPTFDILQRALNDLVLSNQSFSMDTHESLADPAGIPEYLTQFIASPLLFLSNDNERDIIRELASQRISERSGRTAQADMTRTFVVSNAESQSVQVHIHEPTMTSDNLGLKTWSSAYVLAQQLHKMRPPPHSVDGHCKIDGVDEANSPAVLELGAGTGLVGIAAAIIWRRSVLLTDLPAIVVNLAHNIELNSSQLEEAGSRALTSVLDWSQPSIVRTGSPAEENLHLPSNHFQVIIAADPIYDPTHPRLLVDAILYHLSASRDVLVMVGYPIRDAYAPQIAELNGLLSRSSLVQVVKTRQWARDDWKDDVEVECVLWTRPSAVAAPWIIECTKNVSSTSSIHTTADL